MSGAHLSVMLPPAGRLLLFSVARDRAEDRCFRRPALTSRSFGLPCRPRDWSIIPGRHRFVRIDGAVGLEGNPGLFDPAQHRDLADSALTRTSADRNSHHRITAFRRFARTDGANRKGLSSLIDGTGDVMQNSRNRVPAHTNERINQQIRLDTDLRVRYYEQHADEIPHRLRELDDEWDIERAVEANASVLAFVGVALGATHDRRWLALPALVSGFLFQHAIQGWCPPIPILRRLGFRTAYEIEEERQALKALRGDFAEIPHREHRSAGALNAARA